MTWNGKTVVFASVLVTLSAAGLAAALATQSKLKAVEVSVPNTYPYYGEAVAACGAGKRLVGGGAAFANGAVPTDLSTSGPLDGTGTAASTEDGDVAKQWYSASRRTDLGAGEQTAKTFALCSRSSDAKIEATTFTPATSFRREARARGVEERYGSAVATCPGKRRVLGGGVVISGEPLNIWILASGPLDASGEVAKTNDGDVPRQWFATVQENEPVSAHTVFALCSADSKARLKTKDLDVGASATASATVKCGANKSVTGGGVLERSNVPHMFVNSSGPVDRSGVVADTESGDRAVKWRVEVKNRQSALTATKVFAICE